jgi:hypothetical protein
MTKLIVQAKLGAELSARLQEFKHIGPVTARIFTRGHANLVRLFQIFAPGSRTKASNPQNWSSVVPERSLAILLELVNNVVGQPVVPTRRLLCAPDQFLRVPVHEPNLRIDHLYNYFRRYDSAFRLTAQNRGFFYLRSDLYSAPLFQTGFEEPNQII